MGAQWVTSDKADANTISEITKALFGEAGSVCGGVVIAVVAIRVGRIQGRIAPAALAEAFETGAR